MRNIILTILLLVGAVSACNSQSRKSGSPGGDGNNDIKKPEIMETKNLSEIYFAGGCFWGTEHFMKQIRGVEATQVGYANSIVAEPSYEEVCSGRTEAAETVRVLYDPQQVGLPLLLELYFKTIDPTSVNRQGGDRGTQYRTGIYSGESWHYQHSAEYHSLQPHSGSGQRGYASGNRLCHHSGRRHRDDRGRGKTHLPGLQRLG